MRDLVDEVRLRSLLEELGRRASAETRIYLTGGATAVLYGWRESTKDVDLKLVPDRDELYRELPRLKETHRINLELASPDDFIPALPGWEERSPFVARIGRTSVHHYDLYAQALAKVERGHAHDVKDVQAMLDRGLVLREKLRELFELIVPQLYRYPSIDPPSFRRKVEAALAPMPLDP